MDIAQADDPMLDSQLGEAGEILHRRCRGQRTAGAVPGHMKLSQGGLLDLREGATDGLAVLSQDVELVCDH